MREGKNMQAKGFKTQNKIFQFIFLYYCIEINLQHKHKGFTVSLLKAKGWDFGSKLNLVTFRTLFC